MCDERETLFAILEKTPYNITGITLSKPVAQKTIFLRVRIRQVQGKNSPLFFVEEETQTQTFHKNLTVEEFCAYIRQHAGISFRHLHAHMPQEMFMLLTAKKGSSRLVRKTYKTSEESEGAENGHSVEQNLTGQNRIKNYLIPEGVPVAFLIKLGVMNTDGRILAAKYAKFRQINRFLEFVNDILKTLLTDEITGSAKNSLSIIDYGCGKSYLTFAIYHFLRQKGIVADIIGLDLKKDVVDFCNNLAAECGYDGLRFFCGDIASFTGTDEKKRFDLVISLHACDTATDYALARAVKLNTRAIFAVPCCQHELNAALGRQAVVGEFAALLKYGIIKERFAALTTDVLRAELLESAGYSVQILEFIDTEHTPKNLLIRAVKKTGSPSAANAKCAELSASYIQLRDALKTAPLLEKLL